MKYVGGESGSTMAGDKGMKTIPLHITKREL